MFSTAEMNLHVVVTVAIGVAAFGLLSREVEQQSYLCGPHVSGATTLYQGYTTALADVPERETRAAITEARSPRNAVLSLAEVLNRGVTPESPHVLLLQSIACFVGI